TSAPTKPIPAASTMSPTCPTISSRPPPRRLPPSVAAARRHPPTRWKAGDHAARRTAFRRSTGSAAASPRPPSPRARQHSPGAGARSAEWAPPDRHAVEQLRRIGLGALAPALRMQPLAEIEIGLQQQLGGRPQPPRGLRRDALQKGRIAQLLARQRIGAPARLQRQPAEQRRIRRAVRLLGGGIEEFGQPALQRRELPVLAPCL